MVTKQCQPKPIRITRLKVKKETFDVIETRIEDKETGFVDRMDFAVDPESLMVKRVYGYGSNINRSEPLRVTCFDNYYKVDDIQMPKAGYELLFNKFTDKCFYQPLNVKFNVEYDAKIFKKPPSVEAGMDAWKSKPKEKN